MREINEDHVKACLDWIKLSDKERQFAYTVLFSRNKIKLNDALKIVIVKPE